MGRIACRPCKDSDPLGFPGGAVVESPAAIAGYTGSSPGLGGSHMPRSDWAREPRLLSLRVWSLCSAAGEAAMVRGPRTAMKSGPRSPRLEKALAQKRRPNTAKINKFKDSDHLNLRFLSFEAHLLRAQHPPRPLCVTL